MSRFAKFLINRIDDQLREVPEPFAGNIKLHLDELKAIIDETPEVASTPSSRSRGRGTSNG